MRAHFGMGEAFGCAEKNRGIASTNRLTHYKEEITTVKVLRFCLVVLSMFALALFSANAQGRRGGGQQGGQGGEQRPEGGAPERPSDPMSTPTFSGLRFRSIGPAVTSGRVNGFAVDPNDRARFYI